MNPKVLLLDIETSPIIAYVWDLHDQDITLAQIKKDWNLLAWSVKWLGEPASKAVYQSLENKKDKADDRDLLKGIWKYLDEADVVITQNGAGFDGPRLNARFIMHGMKPPSPYKHFDTYQLVKRVAKFTSNKLEYLTSVLCTKYKKLSHKRFPGWSLWIQCLAGNKAAWAEMRRYNIHDVLSLEEMYLKIRAWAPASLPKCFNVLQTTLTCRTCGNAAQRRGTMVKGKKLVQRIHCQSMDCGAWDTAPLPKEAA